MSYQVLARRWRPSRFSELIGQDVVVRTLRNALDEGRLAHAYLLCGIRGVGKTTIARLMAMAVNCAAPDDGEPCGQCDACRSIAAGSSLDVREMDAASHTGVDDVRELLESVRYPANALAWKVYIIDEAHMLSRNAFNALLKTLEEPPERVLFILATTEPEKLPLTVRSRCQRFDLRRLSVDEIATHLAQVFDREGVAAPEAAVRRIARAADGSVRDALSLAERVLAFAGRKFDTVAVDAALGLVGDEIPREISDAVMRGDGRGAVDVLRAALAKGWSPRACLEGLARIWHELACLAHGAPLMDDAEEAHREWLEARKGACAAEALDLCWQVLAHGLGQMTLVDERMAAEMLLLRLAALTELAPPSPPEEADAAERAGAGPEASGPGGAAEGDGGAEAEAEANLPLHGEAPGSVHADWESVVAAYAGLRPGVGAMLAHVVCLDFGDKVRLALDEHQQRAITQADRAAFAEWLGRDVLWESKAEEAGESLVAQRARRARAEAERLRRHAEQEPHVQALMREMDARLVDVRPPGAIESETGNQGGDPA
ncbi:MAG: DNA polymerase III subunit gamma/tau [Mariprofundaceae bacterium]